MEQGLASNVVGSASTTSISRRKLVVPTTRTPMQERHAQHCGLYTTLPGAEELWGMVEEVTTKTLIALRSSRLQSYLTQSLDVCLDGSPSKCCLSMFGTMPSPFPSMYMLLTTTSVPGFNYTELSTMVNAEAADLAFTFWSYVAGALHEQVIEVFIISSMLYLRGSLHSPTQRKRTG